MVGLIQVIHDEDDDEDDDDDDGDDDDYHDQGKLPHAPAFSLFLDGRPFDTNDDTRSVSRRRYFVFNH